MAHASTAALAPSASHMRRGDSLGGSSPYSPQQPLTAPHSPHSPNSPPQPPARAASCTDPAVFLPALASVLTNHVPLRAPRGTKGKFSGNHLLYREFCGTERAPGSLQAHNYLLVHWHGLSLLKPGIFSVNSLHPPSCSPSPCPARSHGLYRAPSGGFLLCLGKFPTSVPAELPATDHKGGSLRSKACGGTAAPPAPPRSPQQPVPRACSSPGRRAGAGGVQHPCAWGWHQHRCLGPAGLLLHDLHHENNGVCFIQTFIDPCLKKGESASRFRRAAQDVFILAIKPLPGTDRTFECPAAEAPGCLRAPRDPGACSLPSPRPWPQPGGGPTSRPPRGMRGPKGQRVPSPPGYCHGRRQSKTVG